MLLFWIKKNNFAACSSVLLSQHFVNTIWIEGSVKLNLVSVVLCLPRVHHVVFLTRTFKRVPLLATDGMIFSYHRWRCTTWPMGTMKKLKMARYADNWVVLKIINDVLTYIWIVVLLLMVVWFNLSVTIIYTGIYSFYEGFMFFQSTALN